MIQKLKNFINNLENSRIPFKNYLITFFSIIFIRNFLETFSDIDNFWTPVSSLAYFIHYPLFYICLLLAFNILLYWLTGEKIDKIAKVLLFFFPIVLLAPIVDLLISHGQGFNMSYLFGDLHELIKKFITFSWNYSGRGITPGIRFELIIIFFLIGCYLFLKTGKIILVISGIIILYIAGFIMGSLPSLFIIFWDMCSTITNALELFSSEIILNHFYTFNHKVIFIFYPILLVELVIWFWCYEKKKILEIFKNIRFLRVFHYLCMLGIGMFLGYKIIQPEIIENSPFHILILFTSACSVAFAWWWAVGVNDIHDLEGDKLSNPNRPLITGILSPNEYNNINLVILILSLVGAILIRYYFFITLFLAIVLSYIYSVPPFRLKRVPILATFIIALCSVIVCLAGYIIFSNDYSFYGFPGRILITILVTFTIAFNVIDIKDIKGDQKAGVVTLLTLLGEKKGKVIIGILALLAYLSVPAIFKCLNLIPFSLICGIGSYFLIKRKRFREVPVILLYLFYLGVSVYFIYPQIITR